MPTENSKDEQTDSVPSEEREFLSRPPSTRIELARFIWRNTLGANGKEFVNFSRREAFLAGIIFALFAVIFLIQ